MFLCLSIILSWCFVAFAAALTVTVSIAPEKYFLQAVGGDLVKVQVMAPAGSDPHSYEPKPRQMADLSASSLYFAIGVPFEEIWLKRFSEIAPQMRIVDLSGSDLGIGAPADHDHLEQDHDDPHIWLSPRAVMTMIPKIAEALASADPEHASVYYDNARQFQSIVEKLDQDIMAALADVQGCQILIYHPALGHFASDYGLRQLSIETEGKEPGPKAMAEIITISRELGINTVFVPVQFSKRAPETIAKALDGQLQEIDLLAEDWADNVFATAKKISAACRHMAQ